MQLAENQIGGALLRRFSQTLGKAGTMLTAEQVRAIPRANRQAMVNTGQLELYPAGPAAATAGERHIVHRGQGKYDVFCAKLNDEPLSKDEAEELATRPN